MCLLTLDIIFNDENKSTLITTSLVTRNSTILCFVQDFTYIWYIHWDKIKCANFCHLAFYINNYLSFWIFESNSSTVCLKLSALESYLSSIFILRIYFSWINSISSILQKVLLTFSLNFAHDTIKSICSLF